MSGIKGAQKRFSELTLDNIDDWINAKTFAVSGKVTEDMIEAARQQVLAGISDGKSEDEIIDDLRGVLPEYLGNPNAKGKVTEKSNRARLGTIARTNISDVFTRQQLATYRDPRLDGFVEGVEYSALLDSATTQFCRSYNGKRYRLNDPIVGLISPPNHFNCRSAFVPITMLDEGWTPDRPLKIKPSQGFG